MALVASSGAGWIGLILLGCGGRHHNENKNEERYNQKA
jgi:hypothetical protein